ncbi:MAG TPA: hypothetical protein H9815_19955 [Candidatus Ruania gallistercoris]|uniref:Uncharacterized protein n=1 Tax=Candidatus Ruania gallistercoris TaxID=2838746 RepID=A0A9D2EIP6_9MICO|nr:hypothetical protein [Candidatus Ruania gallistercoris]
MLAEPIQFLEQTHRQVRVLDTVYQQRNHLPRGGVALRPYDVAVAELHRHDPPRARQHVVEEFWTSAANAAERAASSVTPVVAEQERDLF